MSKISNAFSNKKALIPFILAGDPSLSVTEKLIFEIEKAGADIIELGIPFSDPLADGPVIQAAHARALKNNVSLKDVFNLVGRVRKNTQIPLIFMLSQNLVEKYGPEKFYADCEKYGVDGVIVPDLPPEEYRVTGKEQRVNHIFMIAPTSTDKRIKTIADASSGFIYLVSATGITGKRTKSSNLISDMVSKIRKYSRKPVAVGFGISTPAQAKEAVESADGVIVGSAIVELVAKKQYAKISKFVASLRKAIDVQ